MRPTANDWLIRPSTRTWFATCATSSFSSWGFYLVAIAIAWLNTLVAIICFVLIPARYVVPARQMRHLTSLRPTA